MFKLLISLNWPHTMSDRSTGCVFTLFLSTIFLFVLWQIFVLTPTFFGHITYSVTWYPDLDSNWPSPCDWIYRILSSKHTFPLPTLTVHLFGLFMFGLFFIPPTNELRSGIILESGDRQSGAVGPFVKCCVSNSWQFSSHLTETCFTWLI